MIRRVPHAAERLPMPTSLNSATLANYRESRAPTTRARRGGSRWRTFREVGYLRITTQYCRQC